MFNCLWFASNICCNDRRKGDFVEDPIYSKEDEEDETLMIWALKHHIDTNYKTPKAKETKKEAVGFKEDDSSSLETSLGNLSEKENTPYKLPLLNFEALKSLNYDSEKEVYSNMEDKLKKIKKRFDTIKEMK